MTLAATIAAKAAPSGDCVIYIAGDYDQARQACRERCERGACVSVERVAYIYTGGEESGVAVRLINYPRFPKARRAIMADAEDLARFPIARLHQASATVVGPRRTVWLSRRAAE